MSDFRTVIDQMGREVTFHSPPKRIVSLVPSQTEFLIEVGAPVIGRTKFCIHPKERIGKIPSVGGTKKFNFDVIHSLEPDLIVGNKEENEKKGIERLATRYPVWMSEIYSIDEAYKMMAALGSICQVDQKTNLVLEECKSGLDRVWNSRSGKALYLIWKNPWMAVGKGTFIDDMLQHLGYQNLVQSDRYPTLSDEEIAALNPDVILLSTEPFPFREKHLLEVQAEFPNSQVQLADGELFSWYGTRLRNWK